MNATFIPREGDEGALTELQEHESRTTSVHGIADATRLATIDDLESVALVESDPVASAALIAHVNDQSGAHAASSVSFSPDGSIGSTDVQTALVEVASDSTGALAAESSARVAGDSAATSAAASAQEVADAALPRSGGVMTGKIVLDGDPSASLHAATKQYVLAQIMALVDGAPSDLDTLGEIAARLSSGESAATALAVVVAGKLSTASNLGDLASVAAARSNLGLGSAATRDALDFQGVDDELSAIAGLASATDKLPYFTGPSAAALADLTSFARSLLDDVDAATARVTIGLGSVDNTADSVKPVSAAQQAALSAKADAVRSIQAGPGLTGGGNLTSDRTISADFGSGAGKIAQGNDARLSDSRAPTAHKSTHATGGTDVLTAADVGAARSTDVQVFLSPGGTWTKPAGAKLVVVLAVGAGGGGGSGRKSASGTAAFGGGGGAGANRTVVELDAALLSSTETVTVPAGASGGAAVSAISTSGNTGSNGGIATFGSSTIWATTSSVANGGSGGSTVSGNGGAAPVGQFSGGAGSSSTTGGGSVGGQSAGAAAGGGSAGSLSATPVAANGGAGGFVRTWSSGSGGAAGFGAGGSGGNGGSAGATSALPGSGGGGGASSTTGSGGSGGNGGFPGGGGGGGGAALDGVGNSGKGGDGGGGIVVAITYS